MREIEAELEAELEILEQNMKTFNLGRISDYVDLDPVIEADVVHGNLKLDNVDGESAALSDSDCNGSGTSTNHTDTTNYAVSPKDLSLRLHKVIQSRLEARITELETALEISQKRLHSMESESIIPQIDSYGKVESSSTHCCSPGFVDDNNDIGRTVAIDLYGEACHESHDEMNMSNQRGEEALLDSTYYSNHIERETNTSNKMLSQSQNSGDSWSPSHCYIIEERWSKNSMHDQIRTWEEQTSSWGLYEISEWR